MIDSGADISILKFNEINPYQIINTNNRSKLTGISNEVTETLATTNTNLYFENGTTINHMYISFS